MTIEHRPETTQAVAFEILRTAQLEADRTDKPMKSSAALCVKDAEGLFDKGDYAGCRSAALNSLRYSVGILHSAYIESEAL